MVWACNQPGCDDEFESLIAMLDHTFDVHGEKSRRECWGILIEEVGDALAEKTNKEEA